MPFLGKTPTKFLDANVNIDGGNIDGTTIGATSAASATVTTFTSTGIDDNATSTAITIDSSQKVGIGTASPQELLHLRKDASAVVAVKAQNNTTNGIMEYQAGNDADNWFFGIDASDNFGISDVTGQASQRLVITQAGNVGIGTTSPDQLLDVGDHTAVGNRSIRISQRTGTGAQTYGGIEFFYDNTAGTTGVNAAIKYAAGPLRNDGELTFHTGASGSISERLRIDHNGNVGIGTTSPSKKLHVSASGSSAQIMLESTDTTNGQMIFKNTSTTNGFYVGLLGDSSGDALLYHGDAKNMQFWTSGAEKMRIDSSGRVGIGTSSPSALLHLQSSTNAQIRFSDADDPLNNFVGLITGSDTLYIACDEDSASANSRIGFRIDGAEHMRIDTGGNVGIGTTSPQFQLHLSGSAPGTVLSETAATKYYRNRAAASALTWDILNTDYSFNSEAMRIDSTGYVLIGTTSTTVNTSNFGTAFAGPAAPGYMASYRNVPSTGVAVLFGGNAGQVYIRGDGDLENTNNSYGAISDERLKSNIVDASSQIDDIMAVQVRSYTLNETGATHIGVVAQELEASGMSGLVKTDDEGMKAVKYSVLYMKAIKALQEAVTRIETLEAEVAALKGA